MTYAPVEAEPDEWWECIHCHATVFGTEAVRGHDAWHKAQAAQTGPTVHPAEEWPAELA